MSLAHVLATGLLAAATSGCVFLDALLGIPPFDPADPSFSFPPLPTAEATFEAGHASISVSSVSGTETIVLDRLVGEASVEAGYGTHVTWASGTGWYLSFFGFEDEAVFPGSAYLSLDLINGTEHRVLVDQSRCVATLQSRPTAAPGSSVGGDPPSIAGTAICRGLRWADYFSASTSSGFPQPLPDLPAFDADITFEAH